MTLIFVLSNMVIPCTPKHISLETMSSSNMPLYQNFKELHQNVNKNYQNQNLLSPFPSLTIWVLAFNFTPHTCVHLSKTD